MKQILPPMPLQDEILVTTEGAICQKGTSVKTDCNTGIIEF